MDRSIQWLNANAYRAYPLVEDADRTFVDGGELDNSAILDFQCANYRYAAERIRLARVEISAGPGPRAADFVFNYVIDHIGGPTETVHAFTLQVPENAAFPYRAEWYDERMHHVMCLFGGGVAELFDAGISPRVFAVPPAIEPALVSFQTNHRVFSVRAEGPLETVELAGAIHVREGNNCQVTVRPESSTLVIAAILGAGRGISCETVGEAVVLCEDVLLRLNGMRAGDNGEFMLVGRDGVQLVPEPDNHQILIRVSPAQELECG